MKRFLRTAISLLILLLIVCTGTISLGQAPPHPDLIPGLARCGDRMCFLGILPGVTAEADARRILHEAPDLMQHDDLTYVQTRTNIQLKMGYLSGKVSFISFAFKTAVTAREVWQMLGMPCAIYSTYTDVAGEMSYYYPDVEVGVSMFLLEHNALRLDRSAVTTFKLWQYSCDYIGAVKWEQWVGVW
jgi:hypothetical protein